ncbi:hypothetical protein FIBSPDRAFT_849103 [Athelia psychrophila]|uniref:Uncharacterized protein n=1 Tax=Athelia psychrophila TaxID=1759441 RepID=A0A166UWX5_9AGAM|nr:hypothetical protein FIBSPDRAFT_849103 [Fibularhizoctonia sp. CBS 109695]
MPLRRGLKTSSAWSPQPLFTPYVAPLNKKQKKNIRPPSWTRRTFTSAGTRTRMPRGSYQHPSGARSRGGPG